MNNRTTHPAVTSLSVLPTLLRRWRLGAICAAVGLLAAAATRADDATMAQAAEDRARIQNLLVQYVTALDTRDAAAYAEVFTPDARFDVAGQIYQGRAEIRQIVTGLIESRARAEAAGTSPVDLYHAMMNTSIELSGADRAHHESYWQTLRKADDGSFIVGAMGRYIDELIKIDGRWLIDSRTLTNFAL
jgi:ketosteroid isomerase-like protein